MINILSTHDLLGVPEPPWLITDILRADQVGVLYGPPNKGKTFLALDWGLHVAAGLTWQGKAVTQGPTLFMVGEGAFSMQSRVDAWMHYHGQRDVAAYFQCRPLNLRDSSTVEAIADKLLHYYDAMAEVVADLCPRLIIVDTLSQFIAGGDENGSDMALFVMNCRALSQKQDCAVLIVHHTNAGGQRERGHTALRGNVDVVYQVDAVENDGRLTGLKLINDKMRDDPKAKPMFLPMGSSQSYSHQSLVILPANSTIVPGESPLSPTGLYSESLRNLLFVCGTMEDRLTERTGKAEWIGASGLSHSQFYRQLGKLLEMKLVAAAGKGVYRITIKGREAIRLIVP